ncbi:MAG TPA: hypothetical protein VLI06_04850, partial [Solimonas sp.]|nr:hypothetical protein [Solimonas sp.]
ALLAQPVLAAAALPVTPEVWNEYFATQGKRAEWAGTVRGEGRAMAAGRGRKAKGAKQDAHPGDDLKAVAAALRASTGDQDVIVPLGWIGSGKDPQLVAEFAGDLRTQRIDQLKRELTEAVVALQRDYRRGRIWWQIGNEINSRHLAQSLGTALELHNSGAFDDPALIPAYAENVFAPTVEALLEASKRMSTPAQPPRIVLGTIANARRESSRAWLQSLLQYRIRGTHAPSLAGSRVADHVSILGLHYVVTADDPPWEPVFDQLDRQWRLPGTIQGIWGTEEIGGKLAESGAGAATALRVAASYLHRAATAQLDATALRCSLFGWQRGGRQRSAAFGMELLQRSLGPQRLRDETTVLRLQGRGPLQGHAFVPVNEPARRVAIVFGRGAAATLESIELPALGGTELKTDALLLSAAGPRTIALVRTRSEGVERFRLATPLRLGVDETLLLRQEG